MILKRIVVVATALLIFAAPARGQGVRKLDVSFNDGRVTVVAENVTLAEIFAEWSRKGGSRFVNAERLPNAPVMLTEFKNQPEADVLRTLLREAPGYGAAMRPATAGASTVQTVFILAVRSTVASASSAQGGNPQPMQPQPQAAPRMLQGTPDDEIPPVRPLIGDQPPTMPGSPAGANQPTNSNLRMGPGGTVTSTVPGVIIPSPGAPAGTKPPAPPAGGRGGGGGQR